MNDPVVEPFRAMAIGKLAFQMEAEGRDILHMEYGQPSAPAPALAQAAAHDAITQGVKGYWESEALKDRIAGSYQTLYGAHVRPAQIFLTCGASPALVLALASQFAPGDRIAIGRPGYVAYRNNLAGLQMEAVEIPCDALTRFQVTAQQLEALDPAPAGVIIASPANPTGTIIPPEELAAIAAVCARRGIKIISDEIYHRLTYTAPAISMARYAPDALIVNSFSKYFCMPGWRLGWLVAPESQIDRVTAYLGNFFLTAPSISQAAGVAAFEETSVLDRHIDTYAANRKLMLDALPQWGLSEIAPPDGAFYIYANIAAFTDDSVEFCRQLLVDTGVATAPGVDFDPVQGHQFMRFSFAVSTDEIHQALSLLGPWFASKQR